MPKRVKRHSVPPHLLFLCSLCSLQGTHAQRIQHIHSFREEQSTQSRAKCQSIHFDKVDMTQHGPFLGKRVLCKVEHDTLEAADLAPTRPC